MYIAPPIFDARKSGLSFAKRTYLPRVAGLGLGFICVCAALYPWLRPRRSGYCWPFTAFSGRILPTTWPAAPKIRSKPRSATC